MAEMEWTPAQEKAIFFDEKSVIISAAAGSGKTTVLVNRILNKICDEESPVRVDRLLVVTFSRAAAAEMKERLIDAIDDKIKETPGNKYLLRQRAMIPLADICNMDQFFNAFVKDNYHLLGITPDFNILDKSEFEAIKKDAADEVLEKFFDEGGEDFLKLCDVVGTQKTDSTLAGIIKSLNDRANAHTDPERWLDNIKESYSETLSPEKTEYGRIILERIRDNGSYAVGLMDKALEFTDGIPQLESYHSRFITEKTYYESVLEAADRDDWDRTKQLFDSMDFGKFPSVRSCGLPEQDAAKALRYRAYGIMCSLAGLMPATSDEFIEDAQTLYPVVSKLIEVVKEFREVYARKKAEVNALDFNDITLLALGLLFKDGEPTPLAKEIRDKYDEILIDEYQDTNEAQDAIFCALSKNMKNLFLVGDIKQSIYQFRLAMPFLFLRRMEKWGTDDSEEGTLIHLDKNYRSRESVLKAVNFIFSKIMSKKVGDLDYDGTQSLKYGAKYGTEDKIQFEMNLLDNGFLAEAKPDYKEYDFIADRVEQILKEEQVYNLKAKTSRKAEFKDICILFQKNAQCSKMAQTLISRGYPVFVEGGGDFFSAEEVNTVVSLLRIIDNPIQDIPLLNVLMSPLFGFDADDVSLIRINKRKGRLYNAVRESDSEKAKNFVAVYEQLRRLSTVMSVKSLIRYIYESTGFLSSVGAMNGGDVRRLNLMKLLSLAENYESYSNQGLSGFMRYIDRCSENNSDIRGVSVTSEDANVIKIMTVHKSKGLEFPIVIIGGCETVGQSDINSIKADEKLGLGIKIIDKKTFRKYTTVQFEAVSLARKTDDYSERLRKLYVAMTRAKEKLILCGTVAHADDFIAKHAHTGLTEKIHPCEVLDTTNFMGLFVKAYLKHKDADEFRKLCKFKVYPEASDFDALFRVIREPLIDREAEDSEVCALPASDSKTLALIREKTGYIYPYSALSTGSSVKAASAFNELEKDDRYFASALPFFAKGDKLTAAERGTLTHRFMELCDFSSAEKDVKAELDRLVAAGKFTEKEASVIDLKNVRRFFESRLYERIRNSQAVYREQKFSVFVPLSLTQKDLPDEIKDEKIFVQGVIDLAFIEDGKAVVLDYKTDRVKDVSELSEKYRNQLNVYKTAAAQIFGTEVKELLIYSFALGEESEIK